MKKYLKMIVITMIITAVIIVGGVALSNMFKGNYKNNNETVTINDKPWQAVFLSNGQVYFGHLNDLSGQFITLSDIYYLQIDKPLQSSNPEDKLREAEVQAKLQLIKLGKELHGPKDQMMLNRDHILFIEELSSDSKVVAAIDKYNKEKK